MKLPLGFQYASVYAGIRKVAKDDLSLIVSASPAAAAIQMARNHRTDSNGVVNAYVGHTFAEEGELLA